MTFKHFLSEPHYAFVIAKIAIVFQTILTIIIGTLLVLTVNAIEYPWIFLTSALLVDLLFVCTHLLYRGLYTGQKITLKSFEKKVLIYHVISSILALIITGYVVIIGIDTAYELMCSALASWLTSLVSGVIFFYKKYGSNMSA